MAAAAAAARERESSPEHSACSPPAADPAVSLGRGHLHARRVSFPTGNHLRPLPPLPWTHPPDLTSLSAVCIVASRFSSYSAAKTGENGGATGGGKRSRIRRIVSIGVISIAGGVALSALNDLAIFHGCSRSYFSPFLPSRHSLSVYEVRAFFLRCSSLESLMLEHQYYPCNI